MLGRLFNNAQSAATSPSATRPSTAATPDADDLHTRTLLYPDLLAASFAAGFDARPPAPEPIALERAHLRVVIAQDSCTELKQILFDTKPYMPPAPTGSKDGACAPLLGRPHKPPAQGVLTPENEMKVLTNCMFGSAPLAYKGPSTKVHMLPNAERATPASSPAASRRGSLRAAPQCAPPAPTPPERRTAVLITRLFSVVVPPTPVATFDGGRSIPPAPTDHTTPTPASSVGSNNGFPFPKMNGGGSGSPAIGAPKVTKPPKTSMYAVGLVISLPPNAGSTPAQGTAPIRCHSHKTASSYEAANAHGHEYCPPSFDDDDSPLPSSLASLRTDGGLDDFAPATAHDGMSLVTKHWDVITRALADLQRVAQARISESLASTGFTSPQNAGPPPPPGFKLRKRIELRRMALMHDETVCKEVERLRWRVVTGIKVPRVVVGQGRWRIWKEEAKWINSRFGGREMNFFFLTLLTAFLGHHTEWLDVLGPECYKRRHHQRLKARGSADDCAIPTRTVIVANDRVAARRLIYLLSAFLPAKSSHTLDGLRQPGSRTSSIHNLSQSPGSAGSKMGARQKPRKRPSKLNMMSCDDDELPGGWDARPHTPGAAGLPVPAAMAKCSSTGTLTTQPSAVAPATGAPASPPRRPGSSGSVASLNLNLMATLRRTGTANTSMDSNASGWGSFLSFWSHPTNKSRSSATSEASEHRAESVHSHRSRADDDVLYDDDDASPPFRHAPFTPPTLNDMPAPISVDVTDGTVDIDIPLMVPSLPFSPLGSPPSWSFCAPGFLHRVSAPPLPPSLDDDHGINVAGWIEDERFHPDFTLQAVKPYADLDADLKRALRAEPTPHPPPGASPESESGDRWVEVASVLIADTKQLQIRRVRLQRRIRPSSSTTTTSSNATTTIKSYAHYQQHKHAAMPSADFAEEDEIIDTELVCDVDDVLATAIERVIGVAGVADPIDHTPGSSATGESAKCAILGALETVIGDVVHGRRCTPRWGGNVLTEGVRQWVEGIDT